MRRAQIYLDDDTSATLARVARETGRTRSQLIREAIEARFRAGAEPERVVQALLAAAGCWRRRNKSGVAIVERLRAGRLAAKLR